jgi:FtsP/CotA-like multicopper oxidase with cupredoxin domain
MITRRRFLKGSHALALAASAPVSLRLSRAVAESLGKRLSDPAVQPKFVETVPNPMDPAFTYQPVPDGPLAGIFNINVEQTVQQTGLRKNGSGQLLNTTVWGYGANGFGVSWPGRTFQVQSNVPTTVRWNNELRQSNGRPLDHLLPVDTSLHWCYSLHGYERYSIKKNGVPIITHLHGGHSDFQFDGNPEYFYSPDYDIVGPRWAQIGGLIKDFVYLNDQPAGALWYHDHALGITRLNVYAGMAGFYIVRDGLDTGTASNPLGLPAFPYEMGLAVQDRMFADTGELFYPAFPGDPFWEDFITGEGLADGDVPQPSALAEFFGDHMVVNGKIWPKADVEPRHYRLRFLNGCDSRFMVLRFRVAASADATSLEGAGAPLPFHVIGGDQGFAASATQTDTLLFEPGGRYDIVFDFAQVPFGSRLIVENLGGDAPFGGEFGDDLGEDDFFEDRQTDRIMAFDVTRPLDGSIADSFFPSNITGLYGGNPNTVSNVRKVALFEGADEYGRLQPLLGTAEPTQAASGQVFNGAIAWHSSTTENPAYGATEDWEIYNATMDAHPVHLHLVNFEVLGRQEFSAELVEPPVVQHNGKLGTGFRLENIQLGTPVSGLPGYVENFPRDMVTALPGQVTRIRTTFDKPGRYVWHCHILSHEDHEMMRVLHVGPGAE